MERLKGASPDAAFEAIRTFSCITRETKPGTSP